MSTHPESVDPGIFTAIGAMRTRLDTATNQPGHAVDDKTYTLLDDYEKVLNALLAVVEYADDTQPVGDGKDFWKGYNTSENDTCADVSHIVYTTLTKDNT